MKRASESPFFPAFASLISVVAYAIVFYLAYPYAGGAISTLAVIPVTVVSWFYGVPGGVFAGIASILVNTLLFNLTGTRAWNAIILHKGIPGTMALIFVGAAVGYLQQLRAKLKTLLSERSESGGSLKAILGYLRDGLFILDPDTDRFIFVNNAMCGMFGYSVRELVRKRYDEVLPFLNLDARAKELSLAFSMQELVEHDAVGMNKNGTLFPVLLSVRPTTWEGKDILLGYLRDMTAIKETEHTLERRSRNIIREYASFITNDLQEPLGKLKDVCSIMGAKIGPEMGQDMCATMEEGKSALFHIQELLADILLSAKLEAESGDLPRSEFDLQPFVDDVKEVVAPALEGKAVELEVHGFRGTISADRDSLLRVFVDMIENSIGYGREGQPVEILVNCFEEQDRYSFSVRDNGIGIPTESLPVIFAKFGRGANVEGSRGAGLGLFIAKGVVEKLGGSIRVESTVGKGTTFYFDLPKEDLPDDSVSATEAAATA